jgi:hypothetical protein
MTAESVYAVMSSLDALSAVKDTKVYYETMTKHIKHMLLRLEGKTPVSDEQEAKKEKRK